MSAVPDKSGFRFHIAVFFKDTILVFILGHHLWKNLNGGSCYYMKVKSTPRFPMQWEFDKTPAPTPTLRASNVMIVLALLVVTFYITSVCIFAKVILSL